MAEAKVQGISENTMTDSEYLSPRDITAAVEAEMQSQGTSISAVLQSRRDAYVQELNTVSEMDRDNILAKIEVMNEGIKAFEKDEVILVNSISMDVNNNPYAGYPFHISPDCTCNTLNYLSETPCGNCIEYTDITMVVASIIAGFDVRGWKLAADLLTYNRANTTRDVDYWPELGSMPGRKMTVTSGLFFMTIMVSG